MPWNDTGPLTTVGPPDAPAIKILPFAFAGPITLKAKLVTQSQDNDVGVWFSIGTGLTGERTPDTLIYLNDSYERVFTLPLTARSNVTYQRVLIRANYALNTLNGQTQMAIFQIWS